MSNEEVAFNEDYTSCVARVKRDYPVPPGNINTQLEMIRQECGQPALHYLHIEGMPLQSEFGEVTIVRIPLAGRHATLKAEAKGPLLQRAWAMSAPNYSSVFIDWQGTNTVLGQQACPELNEIFLLSAHARQPGEGDKPWTANAMTFVPFGKDALVYGVDNHGGSCNFSLVIT